VTRDDGTLIFAAASNGGGNAQVAWPAKENNHVIGVYSSDSEGNPSSFNPTPNDAEPICTLGQGHGLKVGGNPGKYGTGTSFAAPVATAIAAIVLDFVQKCREDGLIEPGESGPFEMLKSRRGMHQILIGSCTQSEAKRGGFFYITPWHFLHKIEKKEYKLFNIQKVMEHLL
jgi:hypothetical protein